MSSLEQLKKERKKKLLELLETKKKTLRLHFDEGAKKAGYVGKGLLVVGAGVLLLYTVFDRYLQSKSRTNSSFLPSADSGASKLMMPILSKVLQQGTSALFDTSQKMIINYLKNKKLKNERLSGNFSKK